MSARGHTRQVLLFLVAILVPCLVLLVLSLRMISQESGLLEKRRYDDRAQYKSHVRADLLSRLEKIKSDEIEAFVRESGRPAAPVHPETVLVGWVEEGRPALPWNGEHSDRFRAMVGSGRFAALVREAERHELMPAENAQALAGYRAALAAAVTPAQAAYARLACAESLQRRRDTDEAVAQFRMLLGAPPDATDSDGVPVRLRAAESLFQLGLDDAAVLRTLEWAVAQRPELPATAFYLMAPLAGKLAAKGGPDTAGGALNRISARVREMQQASALQHDFVRLDLPSSEPVWQVYGAEPWFVRATAPVRGRLAMVAVRASPVLAAAEAAWNRGPARVRLAIARAEKGEPLGDEFPGLRAAIDMNESRPQSIAILQWRFFYAVVVLMLGATMFGAYLLWRDLRREMHVAELRSQFVSSVSHELKTPLTAIRMFAETLQMGRSPNREAESEYLETIVNESERLSRLVDDVLLFSKIEQGKKTYRFRRTSLDDVIEAVCRTMQFPLEQQGFRLKLESDDGLVVRGDRDALEQAILNLLSNAMKYSGESRDIEFSVRALNDCAVIRVADHGIGIPEEEQQRIFDKYYRAPTRENQLIPGTGLGLTLVSHIAKAHGGRVEIRSAPGQGSAFSIYIPMETGDEHDPGSRG